MTHLEVGCDAASPSSATGPRGLIRWVCTSNPFYVLSALLVCLGLWVSFGSQASATHSWALLIGMGGYTLMLAVTASLLVRFVGVWDDARTVMLLVVLMILATSVTFDVVLARDPATGVACYLGGFVVAVVVSEGMLRGVRLSLPALFRAPYYLSLGLFFLYPASIAPLVAQPKGEALTWAMFGFSPAAGLVALTLLPAIRRGRDYVRDNGSPWPWAWYPWTLFGVLGFAVAARSALLCWSMHHLDIAAVEPYIFGFYFLAPFGLAVAVLLLEIGLVERARGAIVASLAIPAMLVVLSTVGHRPEVVYQDFLAQFSARLGGTPLHVTLLAAAGFYAYATMRRVPRAIEALTAAVAGLAFVAPGTLDLGELVSPRPMPTLAVAALLLGAGVQGRDAWRCLLGTCCLAASVQILLPNTEARLPRGPLAFHLLLIASLILGAVFRDDGGGFLRVMGLMMALAASLVVMTGRYASPETIPSWSFDAYPPIMAALIAAYGLFLRHRLSLMVAGLIGSAWGIALGGRGYGSLRTLVVGLDYIALGLLVFALAVLTSIVKAGGASRSDAGTRSMAKPPAR